MIAKLKGKVTDIFPSALVIDVNGVGYKVEGFIDALEGQDIELYIHTHVREQEIRLFGFKEREEYVLFDQLLLVSGVGPKAALTLIANVGQNKIYEALKYEDPSMLRTTGVGQKTAARIIIDLKSKLEKLGVSLKGQDSTKNYEIQDETREALIGLGYNRQEVDEVLRGIDIKDKTSSQIIKEALKYLGK